ncbi:MAG: AI-2E family transporter [bacterium]|nr:MAG: AI-2E family transporter [bacterium]
MNQQTDNRKLLYFVAGFVLTVVALVYLAPGAFRTLALAFALAYLADPVVDFLASRRVPKTLSILFILLVIVGVIVLLLVLVVPILLDQALAFARELPDLLRDAFERVRLWGIWAATGYEIPDTLPQALEKLASGLKERGLALISPAISAVFNVTSGLVGFILTLASLIIIPVFFFFILRDIDAIADSFYAFVPPSGREGVRNYLAMADRVLGGFIRGQFLVALILAFLYAAGLGLTGIRFGVLIGVISGLLFIVPYVGTVIGILASAIVLIVDFSGWGQVIGVAATFGIAQAIEGYLLTPRITGNRVGLNQLETLVAILIGGEIAGFTGLLIAIPAGGILKQTLNLLRPEGEKPEVERGRGGEGEGNSESSV